MVVYYKRKAAHGEEVDGKIIYLNRSDMKRKMEKPSIRLWAILLMLFIVGCNIQQQYVAFYPVYVVDEKYEISSEPMTDELKNNVILVLNYYKVPFTEDKNGNILIPSRVWKDTDTMWNYTTKANDEVWLQQRK
jgi:hypothetical protein